VSAHDITLRRLATLDEYHEACAIQREIWGSDFTEGVPTAILMVVQKIGGVTAGAFDAGDRMLGFVFGMTGVRDGRIVHWSDLLAVRESARRRGLGARLKEYQAELAREAGCQAMFWTFDPLQARNAQLNLTRLGARVAEYVPDMYGVTGSALHGGIPTDRIVAEWVLGEHAGRGANARDKAASTVGTAITTDLAVGDKAADAISVGANGVPRATPLTDHEYVRVAIPVDITAMLSSDPARALEWRLAVREAMLTLLERGYAVVGFEHGSADSHPCYVMRRS
jgi:predicted GNAT superfamily acetyltransferase